MASAEITSALHRFEVTAATAELFEPLQQRSLLRWIGDF
jgi:hypothetical protein